MGEISEFQNHLSLLQSDSNHTFSILLLWLKNHISLNMSAYASTGNIKESRLLGFHFGVFCPATFFLSFWVPLPWIDCGKFWKRWEYQTLTCLLRNLYGGQEATVRTGHGTTDWLQIGKGVCQGCILSPCLFNLYAEYIMRNAGMEEDKLESRFPGEISITSYMQMTPPLMAESKEELKSLLMKVKKQSENVGLKLNIQKTKIMASGPITSWQIDGERVETAADFIFLGSKITTDGDCSHEIKRLLGRKVMTNLDSILKTETLLCQQRSV